MRQRRSRVWQLRPGAAKSINKYFLKNPAVGQGHGEGAGVHLLSRTCTHPPSGQDRHPSLLKSRRWDSLDIGEGCVAEATPLEGLLSSLGTFSRCLAEGYSLSISGDAAQIWSRLDMKVGLKPRI